MSKLNINFKLSVWQQRKWMPLLLSKDFNEIHYNYILTNLKMNNIIGRTFELSYSKYEVLKNNIPELIEWTTLKDCLLLFKIIENDGTFIKTKLTGLQKYLFFKKITRNPSKYFFSHIVDFITDLQKYRIRFKIYTPQKYSKTIQTIIRNVIKNTLNKEIIKNEDLFKNILNNFFTKNLEIAVSTLYEVKKIDIEKLKEIA